MTPKERETFYAFVAIEKREGRAATLREVAELRGVSRTVVYEQAGRLVEKGMLKKSKDVAAGTYMTVDRCPMCFRPMLERGDD